MSKSRTFFIVGLWVALLPYLGIPFFWKNLLFSISGLALIYLSYMLHREHKKSLGEIFENFRENSDFRG